MLKTAILGCKGMLGSSLNKYLEDRNIHTDCFDRTNLDFLQFNALEKLLKDYAPQVIINCAAYTQVDLCETYQEEAFQINGVLPGKLAEISNYLKAKLVHISTDYVFDGFSNKPYRESDPTNPLSVYGKSKLEGEKSIQERNPENYLIIRTSWLYGPNGKNFIKTIIQLLYKKSELNVVYDQIGTLTNVNDLSEAIYLLIIQNAQGIYHFTNEGVCSWYDIAVAVCSFMKQQNPIFEKKEIHPVLTEEYPTKSKRPLYSVLDKSKFKETTLTKIAYWRDSLDGFLRAYWNNSF